MIHVVSSISYDADLLPHFVDYYLSLGVDSFIIAIDERVPGIWARTETIAAKLPAKIQLVPASERHRETGVEANNKEETRRRFVPPDDWMIPADLDEFIQFPCPLPQLIAEMEAANATFIAGYFSDRLADQGVLAKTQPHPSIWAQFPLEAPVSEMLVQCRCQKVTLCRGNCELSSGHHQVIAPSFPLMPRRCLIHHFKWRQGIAEALQRRVDLYARQRLAARRESEKILDYLLAKGRIVPEDFHASPGWNPAEPSPEKTNVIYTAITGDYDLLKDPPYPAQLGSRLVAFTDEIHPTRFWETEAICRDFDDPCRNAKAHKILAHHYFPNAHYSLWIDGSVRIKTQQPLHELAELYLQSADIAVFTHRIRGCIYREAQACIHAGKDDPAIIRRQMKYYRYEAYPPDAGLAECTVILRRHTERTKQFNEVWWDEIKKHSRRDQLSFNYVAWKLQMAVALLPGKVDDNELFELHPHAAQAHPASLPGDHHEPALNGAAASPETKARLAMDSFRAFRKLPRNPTA
jgi:hypothetical protein